MTTLTHTKEKKINMVYATHAKTYFLAWCEPQNSARPQEHKPHSNVLWQNHFV